MFLFYAVMTMFAQRLPVRFIPKQRVIAAVRDNMVDNFRHNGRERRAAHGTEGMGDKETRPRLLPAVAVAACRAAAALCRARRSCNTRWLAALPARRYGTGADNGGFKSAHNQNSNAKRPPEYSDGLHQIQ